MKKVISFQYQRSFVTKNRYNAKPYVHRVTSHDVSPSRNTPTRNHMAVKAADSVFFFYFSNERSFGAPTMNISSARRKNCAQNQSVWSRKVVYTLYVRARGSVCARSLSLFIASESLCRDSAKKTRRRRDITYMRFYQITRCASRRLRVRRSFAAL